MTKRKHSTTAMPERTRPVRACTSRTTSRLAPASCSQVVQSAVKQEQVYASPSPPPCIDESERSKLRNMWELASVINFFKTFFPILKMEKNFSAEAMENAILCPPNTLLVDIHVALLKGILPAARTTVNRETWLIVLYKKLKDRWPKVAEGPCPVVAALGKDASAYNDLDPATRLIILRALCECRLDQDDVREYMDEAVKNGGLSSFRKEKSGSNSRGTCYWYEDGTHRLYREVNEIHNKELRGRGVSPPVAGEWQVLASNVDEFRAAAETLSASRNRQEILLARKLKSEVIPMLEELQKKKERLLKRQHRQAALLDNQFHENGFSPGRARRERKHVTYTFAEYDRSINEAIKYTRKQTQSPDTGPKSNGVTVIANGHASHSRLPPKLKNHRIKEPVVHKDEFNDSHSEDVSRHSDEAGPSDRESEPREREYADAAYDEDEDIYSDDEIEGEAIYDEEFIRRRKRRKKGYHVNSFDDEYNGDGDEDSAMDVDEEEDMDEDEDDNDSGGNYSDEEDDEDEVLHSRSTRTRRNGKMALRRSKRTTKKRIRYSGCDTEDEEHVERPRTRRRDLVASRISDGDEPPRIRRWVRTNATEVPMSRGVRTRGIVSTTSSLEDVEEVSSGARRSLEEGDEDTDHRGDTRDEGDESGNFSEEDYGEHQDHCSERDEDDDSRGILPSWNHVGNGHNRPIVEERKEFRFLDLNQTAPTETEVL